MHSQTSDIMVSKLSVYLDVSASLDSAVGSPSKDPSSLPGDGGIILDRDRFDM